MAEFYDYESDAGSGFYKGLDLGINYGRRDGVAAPITGLPFLSNAPDIAVFYDEQLDTALGLDLDQPSEATIDQLSTGDPSYLPLGVRRRLNSIAEQDARDLARIDEYSAQLTGQTLPLATRAARTMRSIGRVAGKFIDALPAPTEAYGREFPDRS